MCDKNKNSELSTNRFLFIYLILFAQLMRTPNSLSHPFKISIDW